jgi:hypothetical protein
MHMRDVRWLRAITLGIPLSVGPASSAIARSSLPALREGDTYHQQIARAQAAKLAGPNQIPWWSPLWAPPRHLRRVLRVLPGVICRDVRGRPEGGPLYSAPTCRTSYGLEIRLRLPTFRLKTPCVLEHWTWMKRQQPLRPQWHERATRAEIDEVEAIDKLIANLRSRRESIINRTKMRTQVWVAHHSQPRRQGRKSAA